MDSYVQNGGDHQSFEVASLLKEPSSSLRSISPTKLQTASLVTLTVILIGFALHWLRPVLVPLVIAVAVSYVFIPILDLLTVHLKFPKSVAVLFTLVFGSSVFGFLLWLVVSSVRQITSKHNMKLYEEAIENLFVKVRQAATRSPPRIVLSAFSLSADPVRRLLYSLDFSLDQLILREADTQGRARGERC